MKFKVIGWTDLKDARYPAHFISSLPAADVAVEQELKQRGYLFCGELHRCAESGVPVLNDGSKVWYTDLLWNLTMGEIHGLRGDLGVADPAWVMTVDECVRNAGAPVLPPQGVDESLIVPRESLAEVFTLPISRRGLESVAKGVTTVQIVEIGNGFERACEGDYIRYTCGEDALLAKITDVKEESLASYLEAGANFLGDAATVAEKRETFGKIAAAATYEGETREEMKSRIQARFQKESETSCPAFALTLQVCTEKS